MMKILLKSFILSYPLFSLFEFSIELVLKGRSLSFSLDDVVNLLSLLDVKDPSLPIIPFEFYNLVDAYLNYEYILVNE